MVIRNKILSLKSPLPGLFICFVSMFLFLSINSANAQMIFNNGLTAQQLAQTLAGPGIIISNATFSCTANGIGSFTGGGSTNIGIASGIILATGPDNVAQGPNNAPDAGVCASGSYPGNPSSGDPDLDPLANAQTYDACKLEFDMIPLSDTLRFKYVFASEEYPEFVCSTFNDAFAFFFSGPGITGQQNIALIPNTAIPVAINSVNGGTVGSNGTSGGCTSLAYSQYYVDNTGGATIQYDGFTTVLTAKVVVQPCQTYHLKITIADAGDCIYDSGLLLEAGSLQSDPFTTVTTTQNAIEGCQDGSVNFCRQTASPSPLTVHYTVAGTATNGTDYTTIADSIIIPAGQTCAALPITAISDGITEPSETVMIIYQPGICPALDTTIVSIADAFVLHAGPDTSFCSGGSATIGISPVIGTTYLWSPVTGLSSSTSSNPSVTLTNGTASPISSNYILTATINGCSSSDTVLVTVKPLPVITVDSANICPGQPATLTAGGGTSYLWSTGSTLNPLTVSPASSASYTVTGTFSGCSNTAISTVTIGGGLTITVNSATVCAGQTAVLIASGGVTYLWSTGSTADSISVSPASTATYTVTGTNTMGCSGISTGTVTINPVATANAGPSQTVCNGNSITLAGLVGGSATGGTWSGGAGTYSPDNTTLNAIYTPSAAEYAADSVTLKLSTNDPAGLCTFSSSTVTFYFYKNPVVNFTADYSTGCPIHCTNFLDSTIIGGGDIIQSWNWNFDDGSTGSTSQNPTHCFSLTGFYNISLTVTSNHGCTSTLTKAHFVEVFSYPIAAFNFSPNPASVLDPNITFNNQSSADVNYWQWDFGDNTTLAPHTSNPSHEYPKDSSASFLVTLIVRNADGCYDTVDHLIYIGPEFAFFIPNSFTPNGDGTNDYFFGSGIGITKYDLWIFDRWGNMIFHGKDLNDKWDGKAKNGKDLAQIDVYVWKVMLTDIFGKNHNYIGTVSLVK